MASMFAPPKRPITNVTALSPTKAPEVNPVMPLADEGAVSKAFKKKRAPTSGRASTVLAERDTLGVAG